MQLVLLNSRSSSKYIYIYIKKFQPLNSPFRESFLQKSSYTLSITIIFIKSHQSKRNQIPNSTFVPSRFNKPCLVTWIHKRQKRERGRKKVRTRYFGTGCSYPTWEEGGKKRDGTNPIQLWHRLVLVIEILFFSRPLCNVSRRCPTKTSKCSV